jgi:hypothetical protein
MAAAVRTVDYVHAYMMLLRAECAVHRTTHFPAAWRMLHSDAYTARAMQDGADTVEQLVRVVRADPEAAVRANEAKRGCCLLTQTAQQARLDLSAFRATVSDVLSYGGQLVSAERSLSMAAAASVVQRTSPADGLHGAADF